MVFLFRRARGDGGGATGAPSAAARDVSDGASTSTGSTGVGDYPYSRSSNVGPTEGDAGTATMRGEDAGTATETRGRGRWDRERDGDARAGDATAWLEKFLQSWDDPVWRVPSYRELYLARHRALQFVASSASAASQQSYLNDVAGCCEELTRIITASRHVARTDRTLAVGTTKKTPATSCKMQHWFRTFGSTQERIL
jgi:hypothetical protein